MDLALFDFDGTITERETMPDFMRAAVRPARRAVGQLVFAPLVVAYRLGIVRGSIVRAAICRFGFCRVSVEELEQHGAAFAERVLPTVLRSQAMDRIAWHKARGDRVVVVSGGLALYLRHWAEAHGVELLCSALEQRGGRFTGRYHGAQCVGSEKARRIEAAFPLANYGKVFAYGDTHEDDEMLAMAHEACFRWEPVGLRPVSSHASAPHGDAAQRSCG